MNHRLAIPILLVGLLRGGVALGGDSEAAKDKYLTGVELFKEENYPAALEAFEDSYRLAPKSSVLYNIGMCQMALFRFTDALETFRRYLEAGPDKDWKRDKVNAAILEINKVVGRLEVADAPEGATVYVDGEAVGRAPLAGPIVLDPGQHKVRVALEGFRSMETTVTIASEASLTVRAPLDKARGTLRVVCDREDAAVTVDGDPRGGCPFEGPVTPGSHAISVQAPGMDPVERQAAVRSGEETVVEIALTAPGGGEPSVTPDKTPVSGRKRTVLIGLGAGVLTVGAGLCGMGGYFNYRAGQDAQKGQNAVDDMDTEDPVLYQSLKDTRDTAANDLNRHQPLMVAGYAAGGALVVTGAVLLVVGLKKGEEAPRVAATGNGLTVRF